MDEIEESLAYSVWSAARDLLSLNNHLTTPQRTALQQIIRVFDKEEPNENLIILSF